MPSLLRLALALLALCAPVRKEGGMIAAHHSLLRAGGASSRDYVQDGLYYQLDGIENAGRGVHSATATTWTDLTGGGRDGTFVNASSGFAWSADSLYVYGLTYDNMVTVKALPSLKSFTFEIVFRGDNYEAYGRVWDTEGHKTTNDRFCCLIYAGSTGTHPSIQIVTDADANFSNLPNLYNMADPINLSVRPSVSGNYVRGPIAYVNGGAISQTVLQGNLSPNSNTADFDIGNRSNNPNRGLNMAVFAIRVYNRILTDAEIAANYAIDKARFNLP